MRIAPERSDWQRPCRSVLPDFIEIRKNGWKKTVEVFYPPYRKKQKKYRNSHRLSGFDGKPEKETEIVGPQKDKNI